MIYRVEVSPRAREDLDSLASWISNDNLAASFRLFDEAGETLVRLARFARMGARRSHSGHPAIELRAIPLPSFPDVLMVYEVIEDTETVRVERILHGKRDLGLLV